MLVNCKYSSERWRLVLIVIFIRVFLKVQIISILQIMMQYFLSNWRALQTTTHFLIRLGALRAFKVIARLFLRRSVLCATKS